ncbi:MAG: DUF4160 domain-containing protein [Pseudobdellovibrionaceae bacterium]
MFNREKALEEIIVWELLDLLVNYVNEGEFGITLQRRAQVGHLPKIGNIEVYTDHNPPHFHIVTEKINAKIELETLTQISGSGLSMRQMRNLRNWYFSNNGREKVLTLWNERNPDKVVLINIERVSSHG